MDHDLQERIEEIENLLTEVLKAVRKSAETTDLLRKELNEFRVEQIKHNAKTEALLKQFGARVGSVEERTSSIEKRLSAVEDIVFN